LKWGGGLVPYQCVGPARKARHTEKNVTATYQIPQSVTESARPTWSMATRGGVQGVGVSPTRSDSRDPSAAPLLLVNARRDMEGNGRGR